MIQRLPENVINKIAAGEVVVRPVNAIKELVENSLDAGASEITVTVAGGGFKSVQVQDNGCGISLIDLPVLGERFTTSKLREYSDLEIVNTFGFRGEALASISQVAHVSVITKATGADCGYIANFFEGKMIDEPRAIAAEGTRITFDNLFFNSPLRKRSLGSAADEYRKIIDLIQRFALVRPDVHFVCRKWETMVPDFSIAKTPQVLNLVKSIFGPAVASEVSEWSIKDELFEMHAILSNPNAVCTGWFSFAINGRLVDCAPLRKVIESIFAELLPKGKKPFVVAHLQIPQRCVDVNVHPTKREVVFGNQNLIFEKIKNGISQFLKDQNNSRVFTTLSKAPVYTPQSKKIRTDPGQLPLLSQASNFETSETPTVWVGDLGDGWILLQREDSLLAVDARKTAKQRIQERPCFYHQLGTPINILEATRAALDFEESGASQLSNLEKDKLANSLAARAAELMEIPNGEIRSVPVWCAVDDEFEKNLAAAAGLLFLRVAAGKEDAEINWFVNATPSHHLWSHFIRGCNISEISNIRELALLSSLYREFERC